MRTWIVIENDSNEIIAEQTCLTALMALVKTYSGEIGISGLGNDMYRVTRDGAVVGILRVIVSE